MPDRSPKQALLHLRHNVVVPRIRAYLSGIDDKEVRQARRLARAVRSSSPPDVVAFGDSVWGFRADYDVDKRKLPDMLDAELGSGVSMHRCDGAGYYSTLITAYLRVIEHSQARPVLLVPLCARFGSIAWSTHPWYLYPGAIEALGHIDPGAPLRRIHARRRLPGPETWDGYGSQVITTFAGTGPIDDLRGPLKDPVGHRLEEHERRRMLYAFHFGEHLDPANRGVLEVERMGQVLRGLGAPVVPYETCIPVDEGVALWGEQFRDNAAHNLQVMREALRRGYGEPIEVVRAGLIFERPEFIDPADGTEHLNEHGRIRLARLLADATRAAMHAAGRTG